MPRFISRSPDDHHHSLAKESDSLEAKLAIVSAPVLHGERKAIEDDCGIDEVQPSVIESSLTLCRIEADFHIIKCTPI